MSLIAARSAMVGGGAKLPYDAEVEYLESTGTQWIDTGVVGTQNIAIDVKWSYVSTSANTVQWGVRTNVNTNSIAVSGDTAYATDTKLYVSYGNLRLDYSAGLAVASNTWEAYLANGDLRLYKDGSLVAQDTGTVGNFSTANRIPLFAFWNTSMQFLNRTGGRIYLCKIWNNGELVRDFIPVRIGSEGAMFDRANPTVGMNRDGTPRTDGLYLNRGTGSFVLPTAA